MGTEHRMTDLILQKQKFWAGLTQVPDLLLQRVEGFVLRLLVLNPEREPWLCTHVAVRFSTGEMRQFSLLPRLFQKATVA